MEDRLSNDAPKITRLKQDGVMCDVAGCDRPAQFIVKYPNGTVRAMCEEHVKPVWERQRGDQ